MNLAPSEATCSLVAGRTSVAETMAPRRRAVAMACRPATPTPMMNTLRRRHGARRGHHHRDGLAEHGGGIDHRLVAGEIGLAGEHVHRLRAGDARHELHRHQRGAGARQRFESGAVVVGREDGGHDRPGLQGFDLVGRGPAHLEENVGAGESLGRTTGNGGAGRLQGVVGEARAGAGSRLHPDQAAQRGELLDRLRRHRHAGLAIALGRDRNRDHLRFPGAAARTRHRSRDCGTAVRPKARATARTAGPPRQIRS